MQIYRVKLSKDGRIVIPSACRRKLHFVAGEELLIRVENNEMRLNNLKNLLQNAQDIVKSYSQGQSLVGKLKNMK